MNEYKEKYQKLMADNGKTLKVIICEKLKNNVFDVKRFFLMSETAKEWIIHPIFVQDNGSIQTGDGSYLFKSLHNYENAKDLFIKRIKKES
jgi:hypothetical protein